MFIRVDFVYVGSESKLGVVLELGLGVDLGDWVKDRGKLGLDGLVRRIAVFV